jgi:hypothetical protein
MVFISSRGLWSFFMRFLLALAFCFLTIIVGVSANAASKVALVIGNGDYANINPLPNPANDAADMTAALEQLGFLVFGGNNLDYVTMGDKVGQFADAAADADVTLFFYAGHGVQVNGRNYLIPVNAKMEREASLQFEAIDSDLVLGVMSGPNKTAIAFLDACRDNPLPRSVARKRSTALARGLAAPTMAGGGMLIGFATSPQETAADGTPGSRNSPFTQALLKHINTPGLEIQSLMTRVKSEVYVSTKQEQQPWHNSSLREEFYLVPQAKSDAEQPAPVARASVESEWDALKNSKSIAALNAFIAKHTNEPVYQALAQERLDSLQQPAEEKKTTVLEGLKLPDAPPPEAEKDLLKDLALILPEELAKPVQKRQTGLNWTAKTFFESAKVANDGNAILALLSLPLPKVEFPPPPKAAGNKMPSLKLSRMAQAPALEALLASNPQLSFSSEASTTCLLHWIDRCPYLTPAFFDRLTGAMAEAGLDIMNGVTGFYAINRIAGSTDYMVSNNPKAGSSEIAIIAAIVSEDLEVKQVFGFDLSPAKLGAAVGTPDADVLLTWSAVEGDDLYLSFDATYRCTDAPRKFGFMAKLSLTDQSVKWVSPFNVSDTNFILKGDHIFSANGGSCVDDFVYKLNKNTGEVIARMKLPSAVQSMDNTSGALVLQLFEGAAAYQQD